MRPKPEFDDELVSKSRQSYSPVRSIGRLIIVVAASALVLAFLAERSRQKQAVAVWSQWGPRPKSTVPRALGLNLQAKAIENRRRDPFVIAADASIDPKMLVRAPDGIDEAMVFNPDGRRGLFGAYRPASSQSAPGSSWTKP